MSLLYLYANDICNIKTDLMLSLDFTGEVCLFSCGNGNRKRITALF